jgi:hypothetical protein
VDDDDDVMATMQQMDQALASGGEGDVTDDVPNPCDAYNKIRDILPKLIKIAEKIPIVGARIAAALKILKKLGDALCPA